MDKPESSDHVWNLIEKIPMALLITKDGDALDARPMAARARIADRRIFILANRGEDSDRQVREDDEVIVSFQKDTTHVVVHGHAASSDDRSKIKELWTIFDKAWWDGPDDPRITLISVTPSRAEYWESPGKLISYADMLLSAAIGKKPGAGDHGTVRL
jgi:general stress protein 26